MEEDKEIECHIEFEEESKEKCLALANHLVIELCLVDLPQYRRIDDIDIAHLLIIHCKLLGLDGDDFVPSPRPWDIADKLIMSLRDHFGDQQFKHLDPMMIATREPTFLLFLLQIYDTIMTFYKEHGKQFDNADHLNRTILTNSTPNSPFPQPPASSISITDLEFNLEIVQNDTGNSKIDVKQFEDTSSQHRLQVLIPKQKITRNPVTSNDVAHSLQKETPDLTIRTKHQVDGQKRTNTNFQQSKENVVPSEVNTKGSTKPLTSKPKKIQKAINDKKEKNDLVAGNENELSSAKTANMERKLDASQNRAKGCKTTIKKKSRSKWPTSEIRNTPINEDESKVKEGPEGSYELQGAYSQLQQHLIQELLEMEAEVRSLVKQDANKKSMSRGKCDSKIGKSYDYFGKPIHQRFPYYPYGIIRPKCRASESIQQQTKGEEAYCKEYNRQR